MTKKLQLVEDRDRLMEIISQVSQQHPHPHPHPQPSHSDRGSILGNTGKHVKVDKTKRRVTHAKNMRLEEIKQQLLNKQKMKRQRRRHAKASASEQPPSIESKSKKRVTFA